MLDFERKEIKTIGEVILLLEAQPQNNVVELDFTDQNPCGLTSYRGYYKDLCLDYGAYPPIKVSKLLTMFKEADGKVFCGYKGGDFEMDRKTLVWVAPYGDCGKMLTNIINKGNKTIICTEEEEDNLT